MEDKYKVAKWTIKEINGKKIGFIGMLRTHVIETSNVGDNIEVAREDENSRWIWVALVELQRAHPDCDIIILLSSAKYSVCIV